MVVSEIKRVCIVGVGLIGGSIGMAIRNRNLAERVIGVPHREETIALAKKKGAIDEGTTDFILGTADADLVFVCTPIHLIVPTIAKIKSNLKEGAIITDVGSTKGSIVREVERSLPPNIAFVGGHPMAGTDRFGVGAAHTFLFDNANWILTPTERTNKEGLELLSNFLQRFDARVQILPPDLHDFLVAGISHLPLMVAVSLVRTIGDIGPQREQMMELASSGFRDTTRIASGHPVLARDMCVTNREKILELIGKFKESLSKIESLIREGKADNLEKEFLRVKEIRDSIYTSS